ncbi:MAG: hypothetical protein M0Q26_03455 [Chitinophagaceae bacterium]|nr:hypothetical protein [Chitinophagaceae bacterium]
MSVRKKLGNPTGYSSSLLPAPDGNPYLKWLMDKQHKRYCRWHFIPSFIIDTQQMV